MMTNSSNEDEDDIDNPTTVRPREEFQISSIERKEYERKVAADNAAAAVAGVQAGAVS